VVDIIIITLTMDVTMAIGFPALQAGRRLSDAKCSNWSYSARIVRAAFPLFAAFSCAE
jgi:hypothetical protein